MWSAAKTQLSQLLVDRIRDLYEVEHDPVIEIPPRRDLGDIAFPAPLHLARVVKRNPRQIAAEILEGLTPPNSVRTIEIAGAGYLNVFLRRSQNAASLLAAPVPTPSDTVRKTVIEHTNINPNKAAHIGHLRNSVLGDILGQALRTQGRPVEIQNYIDDTGVQVADVVVGFLDIRGLDLSAVQNLPEPFDFYCWDLYSEVGRWFAGNKDRLDLRRKTLHQLESGVGERAEMGRLVARRIVGRHLKTMNRLGISYDLLTHESDILGLDFFTKAFDRLVATGAVHKETSGKNEGCWVMPLSESEEFAGLEDPDKVIVRSDGTVTYVGKDIAYQLWKFGLLGKDFEYRLGEGADGPLWQTTTEDGVSDHPSFGRAFDVINVIDIRQSYLQKIVRVGLEALGHQEAADRSVHFAYEMVALSTDTAKQLGYLADDEETAEAGKTLEMSGRKGVGVKADDLMDQLEAKAKEEIESRNRELSPNEVLQLAQQIAIAALRFFMVKASTHRVIAFDFSEALSFEGESGPYLQYASVRAGNIRRRLAEANLANTVTENQVASLPESLWSDDLWDLALCASQIDETVEKAGRTLELSLIARHALDLAQKFNALYNRHPILREPDESLRTVRLAATQIFSNALENLASILGVPLPDRM